MSFGQSVYVFEQSPKSNQDVIGDVYCPGKFFFQQREMRISWRLCNNPEIHLWLWKIWSLVVCSQSSFYVTRARKNDKNRQNTLFLLKKRWNSYPTNNFYSTSHFNQQNVETKKYVRTTKCKRLLEMFIVQHVEMESVIIFQLIKRLVSTTVKSAKPAATFWIFLLWTTNWHFCCLAVMVSIVSQHKRVDTTKNKNHLQFWRNFSAN